MRIYFLLVKSHLEEYIEQREHIFKKRLGLCGGDTVRCARKVCRASSCITAGVELRVLRVADHRISAQLLEVDASAKRAQPAPSSWNL